MSVLPKLKKHPIPAAQAAFLEQWLEQEQAWRAAEVLAGSAGDEMLEEFAGLADLAEPVDAAGQIARGAVLLLHPDLSPEAGRPLYILLLREWEPGVWVCAPFGRNTVPALPAEWKTGREEPPLAVLQLWNAHTLPETVIENAWYIESFTEEALSAAWAVFKSQFSGELSAALVDSVGPPVFIDEDPRIDYQQSEIQAMWTVRQKAIAEIERMPATVVTLTDFDEALTEKVLTFAKQRRQALPMAASDSAERHSVSCVWALELENVDRTTVPLPPEIEAQHHAILLDPPQVNAEHPQCGLVSWRLVPALPGATRAWILDLEAGKIIGTAEIYENHSLVYADGLSWERLQPYAENAQLMKGLHLLIELDERS